MTDVSLPPIRKTRLMKLLERLDPAKRDIRLIIREAYQKGGGYEGAVEYIRCAYGEPVQLGTLHSWFSDWDWRVERVLITPGVPSGVPPLTAAA